MAAPKGNRFAAGHGFGRPPIYNTPEEMVKAAASYFDFETRGRGKNAISKPTLSGLIFHLGFASRQTFYEYKAKDDFKDTIARLVMFVESCYEKQLYAGNFAAQFALKNINATDWKDKSEVNSNVLLKIPNLPDIGNRK